MSETISKDMHEVPLKRGDYVQIENQGSFDYGHEAIVIDIKNEDTIAISVKGDDPCTIQLESSFLVQKLKEPRGRLRDDYIDAIREQVDKIIAKANWACCQFVDFKTVDPNNLNLLHLLMKDAIPTDRSQEER